MTLSHAVLLKSKDGTLRQEFSPPSLQFSYNCYKHFTAVIDSHSTIMLLYVVFIKCNNCNQEKLELKPSTFQFSVHWYEHFTVVIYRYRTMLLLYVVLIKKRIHHKPLTIQS